MTVFRERFIGSDAIGKARALQRRGAEGVCEGRGGTIRTHSPARGARAFLCEPLHFPPRLCVEESRSKLNRSTAVGVFRKHPRLHVRPRRKIDLPPILTCHEDAAHPVSPRRKTAGQSIWSPPEAASKGAGFGVLAKGQPERLTESFRVSQVSLRQEARKQ